MLRFVQGQPGGLGLGGEKNNNKKSGGCKFETMPCRYVPWTNADLRFARIAIFNRSDLVISTMEFSSRCINNYLWLC